MKIAALMMAATVSGKALVPLPPGCPDQSESQAAYMYHTYTDTKTCQLAIA